MAEYLVPMRITQDVEVLVEAEDPEQAEGAATSEQWKCSFPGEIIYLAATGPAKERKG